MSTRQTINTVAAAMILAISLGAESKKEIGAIPDNYFRARIDIESKNDLQPVNNCRYAPWKPGKRTYLLSESFSLKEQWEDFKISFVSDADSSASIKLMGAVYTDKQNRQRLAPWIEFDDIRIRGADLTNGDFELLDKKGFLKAWRDPAKSATGTTPFKGKYAVRLWHDQRVAQDIQVKKGQVITITAKVRKSPLQDQVILNKENNH